MAACGPDRLILMMDSWHEPRSSRGPVDRGPEARGRRLVASWARGAWIRSPCLGGSRVPRLVSLFIVFVGSHPNQMTGPLDQTHCPHAKPRVRACPTLNGKHTKSTEVSFNVMFNASFNVLFKHPLSNQGTRHGPPSHSSPRATGP